MEPDRLSVSDASLQNRGGYGYGYSSSRHAQPAAPRITELQPPTSTSNDSRCILLCSMPYPLELGSLSRTRMA